jgi:hypothetical protein
MPTTRSPPPPPVVEDDLDTRRVSDARRASLDDDPITESDAFARAERRGRQEARVASTQGALRVMPKNEEKIDANEDRETLGLVLKRLTESQSRLTEEMVGLKSIVSMLAGTRLADRERG